MPLLKRGDKVREKALKAAEERRKELEKIINSSPQATLPGRAAFRPYPTEYTEFLKEIRAKPFSMYEKAAAFAGKVLPLKVKADFAGIDMAAKEGYLAVDASKVVALTVLVTVLLLAATLLSIMVAFSSALILFMGIVTAMTAWLIWSYPKNNSQAVTMRMSADSVLAVLYMVVYMRTSPNLEGAIRFAAETLTGPLSWDLKKMLWDIQLGAWPSADEALAAYSIRWRKSNEEFSEAINLLRSSASVETGKRTKLFDETITLILNGTAEKTKKYVTNLRMPVMLIHALGVLLPVMGLVLFPIVVVFMSDTVSPSMLFLLYDVILPIGLWFIISNVLLARPPTFSQPDVSLAKDVPPLGKLKVGSRLLPIWPLPVLIAVPLILLTIFLIGPCFSAPAAECAGDNTFTYVNLSVLTIMAVGLGIAIYCLLDSLQKLKVRNDIESIEGEFGTALFQLGSAITGGMPIELAVDKAATTLKGMKIADLFSRTSNNMRRFGYTFEQALFDPSVGAVWWYPSRLIRSVMTTIVESSRKGMSASSDAMITISSYLKGMHAVREQVEDVLGETITSMRFLAMLLTPLVAGVTITMAVVIIQILTQLGGQLSLISQGPEAGVSASMITLPWLKSGGISISPVVFQLIVGLYMLEIAVLLSYFLNRLQFGDDAIGVRNTVGKVIIIAMLVYGLSWVITYSVFGSSIHDLLMPLQLTGGS
ncbi:MAG: hypothetical protein V1887_01000 [Candidatus Aenigmatarchaeota archaeon]